MAVIVSVALGGAIIEMTVLLLLYEVFCLMVDLVDIEGSGGVDLIFICDKIGCCPAEVPGVSASAAPYV